MNIQDKIQHQIDQMARIAFAAPGTIDFAPKTSYEMKQRTDRIQSNISYMKRNNLPVSTEWRADLHQHKAFGFDDWICSRTDCNSNTRIS